jgi:UDP-glucose 4-epimerase
LLRFFNVFGPRQRPDHEYAAVIPKWIWLAIQGKPIEVFGDGNTSRDFTYIDTVLDIAMNAMKNRITLDGAVNIAYGNKITLNDVTSNLKQHFPDLKVIHRDSRPGDVVGSQNNPNLIKQLFPSIVPVSFEIALEDTIQWLKDFGQQVANGPATLD